MERFETIWEFNTANYRVECGIAPEDDLDLSWDDDGSMREGLESGKYVAFVARVQVIYTGTDEEIVIGHDYLGGCIYESGEQFVAHRDGYFTDMVHEAIAHARKHVLGLKQLHA